MPAITQLIPNYIGGVSTQADEKKSPGQLKDLINGYCDPTFGLTKRNGFQFIKTLDTYVDGGADELKDANWFFINRDDDETYFGCITTNQKIRIWNAQDQTECTVTFKPTDGRDPKDYLTDGQGHGDYTTVTVQDRTYVINKKKKIEEEAPVEYKLRTHATIKLRAINDTVWYEVNIKLDGSDTVYQAKIKAKAPNIAAEPEPEPPTNADMLLRYLKDGVNIEKERFEGTSLQQASIPGLTVKQYATSLELECTTPFTIDVKAGFTGDALECYQDEIGNASRLAVTSSKDRRVKVINTTGEASSYFVIFKPNEDSTDGGQGYWEEDLGWDTDDSDKTTLASVGLLNQTMPHGLFNSKKNEFEFKEIDYSDRFVGNLVSNSPPSFVNNTITTGFIYSNRLGFLSNENVIMSAAGKFDTFYFESARFISAADPIDLNCSSIRPAKLFAAIPDNQGVVLFSDFEQFRLYSDGEALTPVDSIIRSLSNYESTSDTTPVDVGTNIIFLSKTHTFTRTMAMTTRGEDANPIVVDIGKVSSEYVPKDITDLSASPQNSFVAMSSQNHNKIFFYRFFANGDKDLMQAWFKWELPGNIQTLVTANDIVFSVVKNNGEYNLLSSAVAQSTSAGMGALKTANPRMDMFYSPFFVSGNITYDSATNMSTLPRPYKNSADYTPVVMQVPTISTREVRSITDIPISFDANTDSSTANSGYLPKVVVDGNNWTIKGDWTGKEKELLVGIEFDFEAVLPKTYFRRQNISDYTANLTLSRYVFSFGDTGSVEFKSKALGSDEWNKVEPVPSANYYNADSSPFTTETLITVPIYQRNKHFDFKIVSNSPFPVSLNSMMWEGQYSSRNYRRAM